MNLNLSQSNMTSKFNYRDLVIFILPVLIFSVYLIAYNPGILTAATYSQLHQIVTGQYTSSSPIFHTFLEMICLKIFKTPLFIGVLQILIFSAIWMIICKYHRNDSVKSNNGYFLQFIITVIICAIPINPFYSVTLSSNVPFSYCILFLCFLIKVMLDKKGQLGTVWLILMAVTLGLMSGFNNYGIIISGISLIAIGYYLIKNGISQNRLTTFVGLAVILMLLVGSLNIIYDVRSDKLDIHDNDAFEDGVDLQGAKNQFFSLINAEPTELENINSANLGNSKYNTIDSFVNTFRENFLLDGLFNNPILYLILSIALLSLIYVSTQFQEAYLIYLPAFLSMVISLLTHQNNMYYLLLVFYLIAIIFISLGRANLNVDNIGDIKPKMPKKLTRKEQKAIPETNPVDDNYYNDLESEIEDLTMEDINEMLGKADEGIPPQMEQTPDEIYQTPTAQTEQTSDEPDLLDEILKEIERDQNK